MKPLYACRKPTASAHVSALLLCVAVATQANGQEYEIGGPLAGVRLPLYKTQHGEPAGHPGCLVDEGGAFINDPQGQNPEWELYPGSAEHWRDYWLKYTPTRSMYDKQSMVKNWIVSELPGIPKDRVGEYAEPVYFVEKYGVGSAATKTDKTNRPVKVVRCGIGTPMLDLDVGTLDVGMYVVRVVAAVPGQEIPSGTTLAGKGVVPFRKPLYLRMTVNDGIEGETNSYRMSVGYLDEFYSTAEFYFHAAEKREYKVALQVDRGSEVELLVHNITLDDVLAGMVRRPIKTRRSMHPAPAVPAKDWKQASTPKERLKRDAEIWNAFPHLNAQPYATPFGNMGHNFGGGWPGLRDKLARDIVKAHGDWKPGAGDLFLVNEKLGLQYSMADFNAGKPLPDPYPYKDDGAGLFSVDMETAFKRADLRGRIWSPIAWEVQRRFGAADPKEWERFLSTKAFCETGDLDNARDVAMRLIRFAYDYPSITFANGLTTAARKYTTYRTIVFRFRRRRTNPYLYRYRDLRDAYDQLFDYVQGSDELAHSVGRFVSWVRTPQDVIKLLDTYLVQTDAKRILRFQTYEDGRKPAEIAKVAALLGDNSVTDEWMEWLAGRAFVYPFTTAGIADILITCCKRDGSRYYTRKPGIYAEDRGALQYAESLDTYLRAGGNPQYNLADPERYPKPLARCYSQIAGLVAGVQFLRIGASGRPANELSASYPFLLGSAESGFRWSGDPAFAFALVHGRGRTDETDAEWKALVQAAAKARRAPWLENRSRVVVPLAAVLESGTQHDDHRFRRAASLRVGVWNKQPHNDSLDLQVAAHGLPATTSAGGIRRTRSGGRIEKTMPKEDVVQSSAAMNLVTVDNEPNLGHAWVSALSDAPGARYLNTEMVRDGAAKLYRRSIALIDVDEGKGSKPLPPAQQVPGAELPKGVSTANSYVFDVVRVSGGKRHTYQFHANISEDFQWNAEEVQQAVDDPVLVGFDHPKFPDASAQKFVGRCPEVLKASWQMRRAAEAKDADGKRRKYLGSEEQLLGKNFDPQSPPKSTRLHLFGVDGTAAYRGESIHTSGGKYQAYRSQVTQVLVRRAGDGAALESAFAAIIEPYAGKPFITGEKELEVKDNETDALRAVALEVTIAPSPGEPAGRADLCFADGRPGETRQIGPYQISGEFAYYSADEKGLRQATITGGTLLEGPGVKLVVSKRERTGKVVAVDYPSRTFRIDTSWPARNGGNVFEIGVPGHMATYTATRVVPGADGTAITVSEGADYYRSRIVSVDEEAGRVKCALHFPHVPLPGLDRNWIASNDEMNSFWRTTVLDNGTFELVPVEAAGVSRPVSAGAFGKTQRLRLWEYGPGDTVRQSTSASLRRTGVGIYELHADIDVEVTLPDGQVHKVTAAELHARGGTVQLPAK